MSTLGERMKRYEHATRYVLPKRTYTIIRVDGKAFHTYTRGLERPFDNYLVHAMDYTAVALCKEMSGAVFAYVQSDEISVLLCDFAQHETEPWMGGVLQKQVSISASAATAAFSKVAPTLCKDRTALFDSRAWTISDPNEVVNYFIWRQRDAVKNSITMAAEHHLGHARLHGLNGNERQELLWREKGINWNDYPTRFKRGRCAYKRTVVKEIDDEQVFRSSWTIMPAEHFNPKPSGWLAGQVPQLPTLPDKESDV